MTDKPEEKSGDEQQSGDNGKLKPPKLTEIEMRIILKLNEPMIVYFPFLKDKTASYGFLKFAEKTLDAYYKNQETKILTSPKGGIMNFLRGRK